MGIIAMKGMEFHARVGFEEEQIVANKIVVDIYIETDFQKAMESDKIDHALNYEDIYKLVKQVLKQKANLLEHVVHNIHRAVIKQFPAIKSLKVRVAKLHPPIKGKIEKVYAEYSKTYV